ncbi:plasmid partitioning protein RepB [Fulvimarina sp. 2208YS6-2-32]|uniref:Plasmid partitioning protein RepB n=1 Tax=Fulvimarina uroteuthidis TaxID=3098149 RepID=A0ABU5I6S9_9HYPH|nr:plasmid partitioning protein RepB [Fulvimarina sp. 2208YS6-2-32]MDY8111089.1 plasmid partitioning protein RepB [Fulvimarina sp. 2208YS6-2-32]
MVKRKDALRALLSGDNTGKLAPDGAAASISNSDYGGAVAPDGEMSGDGKMGVRSPSSQPFAAGVRPLPTQSPPSRAAGHTRSGAINAMRDSWGKLRKEVDAAEALRAEVADGGHVVLIEPNKIFPSPVTDRLSLASDDDANFDTLKASMAESGQAVPVLLRPHSDAEKAADGFFETAYGHRRVRAALELGLKVRAIVRPLSDEELILSQGRENAERRDLSFIERAFFAKALERRGYARETIRAALSIDNTQVTRLLQVAERVPYQIVRQIGAAPRAGRPRWGALGELIAKEGGRDIARDFTQREAFTSLNSSDARFAALFARMSAWNAACGSPRLERKQNLPMTISAPSGEAIAMLNRAGDQKASVNFTGQGASDFAAFVAQKLPALFEEFHSASGEDETSGRAKPNTEGVY